MTRAGMITLGAAAVFLVATVAFAGSVVPTHPIRSQSIIAAGDVVLSDWVVPGAVTALAAAIGRETRVTLYPGRPVMEADLGAPAIIDRNQIVIMVYRAGGLQISTQGRALDRAGAGEHVRIINLDSRTTVTGVVRADGAVEVGR